MVSFGINMDAHTHTHTHTCILLDIMTFRTLIYPMYLKSIETKNNPKHYFWEMQKNNSGKMICEWGHADKKHATWQ